MARRRTPIPSHENTYQKAIEEEQRATEEKISRLKGKIQAFRGLLNRRHAKETYRTRGA